MSDLSVIYYTANRTPRHFEEFVKTQLLESINGLPLISISQKPMPGFGRNICVGRIGWTHLNIYRQMLIGAWAAESKFIAFVEDDILYPPDHFSHRPSEENVIAYDMNKWAFYTWYKRPVFHSSSPRRTTGAIGSRKLFIEALEERFNKYPDSRVAPLKFWGEIGRYEGNMDLTIRQTEEFQAKDPHVVFFHEESLGHGHLGTRKKGGQTRVAEIPYWGKAKDMSRRYYDS